MTTEQINRLEKKMDKYFGLVMEEVQGFRQEMNEFKNEMYDFRQETNKRLDALEEDVRYIRNEISAIGRRLDWLEEQIGNIPGFAKEIDDLRSRIAVIEKQLARA